MRRFGTFDTSLTIYLYIRPFARLVLVVDQSSFSQNKKKISKKNAMIVAY